ncbi:6-bladed beta-propeller [uncultured Desulfuromonas sp.]|uniref:6-bladed beta-propeller n=1 Tax=uncultured Desulfuromonas sp. TaxID=181013 RepID=UPI00374D8873
MPKTPLTCPHCGYSREMPTAKLPQRPTTVNCPRCQKKFPYTPTKPHSPEKRPTPVVETPPLTLSSARNQTNTGTSSAPTNADKTSRTNLYIVTLFILIACLIGGRFWFEKQASSIPYPYWLSASEKGLAVLYGKEIYVVGHEGYVEQHYQLPEDCKPCQLVWHDDELWVSDWENDRILKFSPEGMTSLALQDALIEAHLNVAADTKNDRLFISDSEASRILIYDSDGTYRDGFGQKGHEPGEFFHPKDIVFDGEDQLIVGNTLRPGIDVFTTEGQFVKTITEPKAKFGYIFLTDFAIDDDNLVTLECDLLVNYCVIASYDLNGELLATQPQTPGAEAAGDVAVWEDTAYVTNCSERRVVTYQAATLEPLGSFSSELDDIGDNFSKEFSNYKTLSKMSLIFALTCLIFIFILYKRSKAQQ